MPKEMEIQRALSRRLRELDPDLYEQREQVMQNKAADPGLPAPVPMPQKMAPRFPGISGKRVPQGDLPAAQPMPIIGVRG